MRERKELTCIPIAKLSDYKPDESFKRFSCAYRLIDEKFDIVYVPKDCQAFKSSRVIFKDERLIEFLGYWEPINAIIVANYSRMQFYLPARQMHTLCDLSTYQAYLSEGLYKVLQRNTLDKFISFLKTVPKAIDEAAKALRLARDILTEFEDALISLFLKMHGYEFFDPSHYRHKEILAAVLKRYYDSQDIVDVLFGNANE